MRPNKVFTAFLLLALAACGASADEKISQMPAAGPLAGSELIPVIQGGSNATTTPNALKTFIGSLGVTSISTACGIAGGPITGAGSVTGSETHNGQTGATYSLQTSDCGKLLTENSSSSSTWTLLSPSSAGNGYYFDVSNIGTGALTLTPASGSINGSPSLTLTTTQGARIASDGTNYWALTTVGGPGGGSVSSVGLSVPSEFSVAGSPITTSGTLNLTKANQNPNQIWAGPTSGAAAAPTFRALVGADLPTPTASTLGGVQSIAPITSNFMTGISTAGVPSVAQPSCGSLSNAGSACPVNIGTTGATIPLNSGDNNFSGTVTFSGAVVDHVISIATGSAYTMDSNTNGGSAKDHLVCWNTGAAGTVTLPPSPVNGREVVVVDCGGNAATANITVVPNATPSGGTVNGATSFVMNANREANAFTYIAAQNLWVVH